MNTRTAKRSITQGWGLIARLNRQVYGMGNLRRHAMKRECRDEAYNSLWNLEGHSNEIRVFERLSIGNPVEATIQKFQPSSVSKRIKRTVFYFICVGAVGAFNLFNSLLTGAAVFIGGYIFGRWITTTSIDIQVGISLPILKPSWIQRSQNIPLRFCKDPERVNRLSKSVSF